MFVFMRAGTPAFDEHGCSIDAGSVDSALVHANLFATADWMTKVTKPEKILRMRTVLDRTGLSRSTIYRKMREGTFPRQVEISEHCRGWRESAINRWIADPTTYRENITAEPVSAGAVSARPRLLA
ncbi:MAG TPA: AlpA family phage regulatory protein [Rhizomicrobium sp.]|nr:AlpA family phage regulatory protein [Rhizomicrobium sp.]